MLVRFGRCQPGGFDMKKSRFSEQQIAFMLKPAEDGRRSRKPAGTLAYRSGPIIYGATNMAAFRHNDEDARDDVRAPTKTFVSI